MAFLTIELPDGKRWRFSLNKGEHLIGRAEDADIRVDADWVSGHHARVKQEGQDFAIEDLGSSNGTYVNYERIQHGRVLTDNDIVFLGRTKMVFRDTEAELEESTVELDILSDDQGGVFTQAPPPAEMPTRERVPEAEDIEGELLHLSGSDVIEPEPSESTEQVREKAEMTAALSEANRKIAALEIQLQTERKRAESEANRMQKELHSWKSKYFDVVEELKLLRGASGERG